MPGEQKMADQELIATWMEPKPTCEPITLTECHLVEAKLSDEQRTSVLAWMLTHHGRADGFSWLLMHATVEQKIKALASVLRPVVEPKAGE